MPERKEKIVVKNLYKVFGEVPGKDVSWIEVSHSAHPNGLDTKLSNGKNYSFEVNTQTIVANKDFVNKIPAAAKLFEVMSVSVNDMSAQNLKMKEKGQGGWDAAVRHADAWIAANREIFDGWLNAARNAAR